MTEQQIADDIRNDYLVALSLGITTDQVITTNLTSETFRKIFKENDFGCRVRLIAFPFTDTYHLQFGDWKNKFIGLNTKNYISGVKLILDGTPVERGACMRKFYSANQVIMDI